jgi:hypothetical protein
MKTIIICLFCSIFCLSGIHAQDKIVSRKQFFTDTALVVVTIETDLKKLQGQRKNPSFQQGKITWHNADSTGDLTENIKVRLRGNYRRENCGLASLMVEFRDSTNKSKLKNLKNLKMVAPCGKGYEYEQLVIKEFLVYKIYNQLTDKSLRARLMQVTFKDVNGKMKPYTQFAFVIEPIDDLAKRNNCFEEDKRKIMTEETNRSHTTLVNIFQYMIGNTDWGIPVYHNIKMVIPIDSPNAAPYVIPYDFDYSGLVNAPYAIPHESTGLVSVTERKYMGFPRTWNEIQTAAVLFKSQKEGIYNTINTFRLLGSNAKREMLNFLDDFYSFLNNDNQVQGEFINRARKQ